MKNRENLFQQKFNETNNFDSLFATGISLAASFDQRYRSIAFHDLRIFDKRSAQQLFPGLRNAALRSSISKQSCETVKWMKNFQLRKLWIRHLTEARSKYTP